MRAALRLTVQFSGRPGLARLSPGWLGQWRPFIGRLVELDRRRQLGLLDLARLTWLEVEGLMVLDEERARHLSDVARGAAL